MSQTLYLMNALLRHYEKAKQWYQEPEHLDKKMLHAIEMGWFVLNKYYSLTEGVPAYAAALLLDPSKRLAYIRS